MRLSCQFKLDNYSHIVEVDVKNAPSKDFLKIRNVVDTIIRTNLEEFSKGNDSSIHVDMNDGGQILFHIGEKGRERIFDVKAARSGNAIDLKIIELSEKALPRQTFTQLRKGLLEKWPAKIPLISFIWSFITVPIAAVSWFFRGYDTSSLKIKTDPYSREGLEEAMRETLEVFGGSKEESVKPWKRAFEEGLKIAESFRHSPEGQQQALKTLNAIAEKFENPKYVDPFLLPGGYWEGPEKFKPILWSLYRDPAGIVHLSEMTYGSEYTSTTREFVFTNLDKTQLETMLGGLLGLSIPPQEIPALSKSDIYSQGYITALKGIAREGGAQPSSSIKKPPTYENLKESIIVAAGGKPAASTANVKKEEDHRHLLREDPLKLIHETIRFRFPEGPLSDKALFSLHILENRMKKVLTAFPDLTSEEQNYWMKRFEKEVASLKRQLKKSGIPVDIEKAFSSLSASFTELRTHLNQSGETELRTAEKSQKKLNDPLSAPFSLKITPPSVAEAEKTKTAEIQIGPLERQDLKALQTAFEKEDIGEVLSLLKKVTKRVDDLVGGHHYTEALILYRAIERLIPSPGNIAANIGDISINFWAQVEARATSDQIKEMSDQLGHLSHYFWESKLKLGVTHMLPEEQVAMLNTEAALVQLMYIRKRILDNKGSSTWTTEEKYFHALTLKYQLPLAYRNLLLHHRNEPYLRFSEDPIQAARYQEISNYLLQVPFAHGPDGYYSKPRVEDGQCKLILGIANKPDTLSAVKDLRLRFLSPPVEGNPVFIPSHFQHLSRQQTFFSSFIFSESSFAFYGYSWRGLKKAGGQFLHNITADKAQLEKEFRSVNQDMRAEVLQEIQKYDRLDILPQHGISENWGIFPRGTKPGKGVVTEIGGLGLTGYHQVLREARQEKDLHAPFVGNPGPSYNVSIDENPNATVIVDQGIRVVEEFYENEVGTLDKALSSKSSTPLDLFSIRTMQSLKKPSDELQPIHQFWPPPLVVPAHPLSQQLAATEKLGTPFVSETIHELFDLVLQRPQLLEFTEQLEKSQLPHEGERRFYSVLFQPNLLRREIEQHPEFFISHGPLLQQLIERLFLEKRDRSATFLLYLVESTYQHMLSVKNTLPPEKRKPIENALATWPHQTKESARLGSSFFEKAQNSYQQEPDFQKRLNQAAYHVSSLANRAEPWKQETLESKENQRIAGKLLKAGLLLEIGKGEASLPIVAEQAHLFLKERLVPLVLEAASPVRDSILDTWMDLEAVPGPWKEIANQPGVFEKGNTRVDLYNLQVVLQAGKPMQGMALTEIPTEVTHLADYRQIFGEKNFPCEMKASSSPGVFLITFNGLNNAPTQIVWDSRKATLSIEQKFQNEWHRFCSFPTPPKEKTLPSLEQLIQRSGIWIQTTDPRKGLIFPAGLSSKEPLVATLNGKGNLLSVKTSDHLDVVNPTQEEAQDILATLPSSQLLFLKEPGSRAITEIRLLHQPFSLHREDENKPWIVKSKNQLSGTEWVVGRFRRPAVNHFLKSLGKDLEKSYLTVRKEDGRTSLLIFPYPITKKGTAKTAEIEVNQEIQTSPPLEVTIDDFGKVTSSASGYFALGYLFATQHDFEKAAFYIEKARHSKIESKEELMHLMTLFENMKNLAPTSKRSSLIQLKGILAVLKIFEEQSRQHPFAKEQWKLFLQSSSDIGKLFREYNRFKETSPYAKVPEKEGFTAEELFELQRISQESFEFAAVSHRIPSDQATLSLPGALETEMLLPVLLVRQDTSPVDLTNLLKTIPPGDPRLLSQFFFLYNYIVEKKIPPNQLQALFAPLPNLKPGADAPDETTVAAMQWDMARKLLITASTETQRRPLPLIDLQEMRQLRKQVPEKFLTIALWTGIAAWRFKRSRDPESLAETQLLRRLNRLALQMQPATSNKELTLNGYASEKAATQEMAKALQNGLVIDVKKLREAVQNDPTLFGSRVNTLLRSFFSKKEVLDQLKTYKDGIPADQLISFIEQKTAINLMLVLKEEELNKRIQNAETFLATRTQKTLLETDPQIVLEKGRSKNPFQDDRWQPAIKESASLKEMVTDLSTILPKENALMKGFEEAQKALQGVDREKVSLSPHRLEDTYAKIRMERDAKEKRMQGLQKEIFAHLPKVKDQLPKEVKKGLDNLKAIGEWGVLDLLIQAYQSMEPLDNQTLLLITQYIMEKAAHGVLSRGVEDQLKILAALKKQGVSENSAEWINASTLLSDLISRSLNFDRYLDKDGHLLFPNLYRKILTMEANYGIILTKAQIDLIIQVIKNPSDWYELRVGLGKTSVVFPIVLMILIEMGVLPTAVVKEELLQQNLDSLDRATRDLLEKAGVEFRFQLNDPISSISLQEQYLRLLHVQSDKGYPITTLTSVIAIDQKIQLLNEELLQKTEALFPKLPALMQAMQGGSIEKMEGLKDNFKELLAVEEIQKSVFYLEKIRQKLGNMFIDEADDILDVIKDIIVGRGDPLGFDITIQETMRHLMNVLFSDTESQDIRILRDALLKNRQAALSPDTIKNKLLPALANALLSSPEFQNYLGTKNFDIKTLTEHLTRVYKDPSDAPRLPPFPPEVQKKLGALKHILQGSLPVALLQNPGIDVATKKSDGFQIGPHVNGKEQLGTVFSDEYDLIVNHFLHYGIRLPESDPLQGPGFLEKGIQELQDKDPVLLRQWNARAAAEKQTLVEFLNDPKNFRERMIFVDRQIFQERRIRRYGQQIVLNVQDVCLGRKVGGMTGTLNRDCLPEVSGKSPPASRHITGQVILEAGLLAKPTVTAVEETEILNAMRSCAKDKNYKAIINQGYYLTKGDAKKWVSELRKDASGKAIDRIFIFVDSHTQTFYSWGPHDSEPSPISKKELNRLAVEDPVFKEKACFAFAPPDTRGTDFKIPPGKGAVFISPRCSMESFVQTLGRMMRGAGTIHSMNFFVSQGIAERIQKRYPKQPLSYARLVGDIYHQENFVQEGKNLKAAMQSLKTVVKMGTRRLLWGHPLPPDTQNQMVALAYFMMLKNLTAIANDPKTGWLEESREIQPQSDFGASSEEETEKSITRVFQQEQAKLDKLKTVIAPQSPLFSEIQKMEGDLALAYANAIEKLQASAALPQTVPRTGAGEAIGQVMAQAQVQEVQQQQQQEQQIQQVKSKRLDNRIKDYPYYTYEEISLRPTAPSPSNSKRILLNPPVATFPDPAGAWLFWNKSANFKVTRNFIDVFRLLNGVEGNLSLCRFMVKRNGELVVIGKNDYHHTFSKVGKAEQEFQAIFALVNPEHFGTSFVLDKVRETDRVTNVIKKEEPVEAPPLTGDLLLKMVQAKWMMGATQYTADELAVLKKWLVEQCKDPDMRRSHDLYLHEFGSEAQRKLAASLLA